MQDMVHIRHILQRCLAMANGLRQYVMWMNAVNTSNTSVCKMVFSEKKKKKTANVKIRHTSQRM